MADNNDRRSRASGNGTQGNPTPKPTPNPTPQPTPQRSQRSQRTQGTQRSRATTQPPSRYSVPSTHGRTPMMSPPRDPTPREASAAPSTVPGSAGSIQRSSQPATVTESEVGSGGSFMYDLAYDPGYHSGESRGEDRAPTPRAEEEERRGWCDCFPATSANGIPSMVYDKLHCVHHNVTSVTHGPVAMFADNWIVPGAPPPLHRPDYVRTKKIRTIQPHTTYISGYPPNKYGYNIPWDSEWRDFMAEQEPEVQPGQSRGGTGNGSRRPETGRTEGGYASIAEARSSQARASRADVTEFRPTATRGSQPRAVATGDSARLPDITRQGRSQGRTQGRSYRESGTRQTRLPPISEPTGSVDTDEGYHGNEEPDVEEEARGRNYESYKMTERVQQGKLFDPASKRMMLFYIQPGEEQWTARREYVQ